MASRASARVRRALGTVVALALVADGQFERVARAARSTLGGSQAGDDDEQEGGSGADAGEAALAPGLGSAFLLGGLLVAAHLQLLQLVGVVDFARHEAQLEDEAEEHEDLEDDGPGLDGREIEAGLRISPNLAEHHRYQVQE